MRDLFGNRPFQAVAKETLAALGGRAPHDALVEAVQHRLTMHEYKAWADRAFRSAVINSVKSKAANDLDAVYGTGEEVSALRLFTVEEFEDKARSAARLSKSNRNLVFVLSDLCMEAHGRTFDPEQVVNSEQAA